MDYTTAVDNARDDFVARTRLESFKLGKVLPSSNVVQKHTHSRSHSRNSSVSSSVSSLSLPTSFKSTNSNDISSFSFPAQTEILPGTNPAPPAKRNSHHRRRSSVSTRRESAEMMGVSLPDLPLSTSDNNINLGEKDSIRRRALWALEGKPDIPYNKVEIPELTTPVMEKMMFDFSSKLSISQASTNYGTSLNPLMPGKRDSFKLLASSSSSKDQLHTLVEEEEEEEEDFEKSQGPFSVIPPGSQEHVPHVTPSVPIMKPTPSRPRPVNLNLRPLSLTPENLVSVISGLPTPSLTPSPTPRTGLKSLSLTPSPSASDDFTNSMTNMIKRRSLVLDASPTHRRPSLNLNIPSYESSLPATAAAAEHKSTRRSSISYKSSSSGVTSFAGLPTPEMTPTSVDRRYSGADSIRSGRSSSTGSNEGDFFPHHPTQSRPLSASEQHFLFKSHNALLARITDLERALSIRRRSSGGLSNESSRPASMVSDVSSSSDIGVSNGGPSDEMLRLIADLKGERDELKKDVDGWRMRVGDIEKQLSIVTKRVDNERREAWVARSRVGLLEVEKGALEKKLGGVETALQILEEEKNVLVDEKDVLERECGLMKRRISELEEELEKAKQELNDGRTAGKAVFDADVLATPTASTFEPRSRVGGVIKKRDPGFTSVDSESSATDVEVDLFSFDESTYKFGFQLKAVEEESEAACDEDVLSEEDNGLDGYEDEEESDISFRSSSSCSTLDESPRSLGHLYLPAQPVTSSSGSATPTINFPSPSPVPADPAPIAHRRTDASKASLVKTWTFPRGNQASMQIAETDKEIDRFFGCLEDVDRESSEGSAPVSPSTYTYEGSKGLFASGFNFGSGDDNNPFFLPQGVGVEIGEEPKGLEVVTKEEEAKPEVEGESTDVEEEMFGEIGGIRITFTPPDEDELERSPSPVKEASITVGTCDEEGGEEGCAVPFNFGRPLVQQTASQVASTPPKSGMITPPSSTPRPTTSTASPSSIPRPTPTPPVKSLFLTNEIATSTPPKSTSTRSAPTSGFTSNAFVTPPTKRGGTMPSFIPQPVSSPSTIRHVNAQGKPKLMPTPAFIRQPQRRPLMSANTNDNQATSGTSHGSTFQPQPVSMLNSTMNAGSLRRSSDVPAAASWTSSEMKSVNLSGHDTRAQQVYEYRDSESPQVSSSAHVVPSSSSFSSIMSSPLSVRLSFQTLTNFIPLSWSPRGSGSGSAASVASRSAPVSSSPSDASGHGPEQPGASAIVPLRVTPRGVVGPLKRVYVSKEKQLEALRSRLEREGAVHMRSCVNVCCKKCDGESVFL